MKIVIESSGGVVDVVHVSEPNASVDLLDWDDVNEGEKLSDAEQDDLLAETTKETPYLARWVGQQDCKAMNIPEHETEGEKYPGDIQPGNYTREQVVALLRKHKNDPEAVQFVADMME